MRVCNCNLSFANTGEVNCKQLMSVARKIILVPTYDSLGARNTITPSDVLNAAFFSGKINQADPMKRWYPTGYVDNVKDERAEPIMETLQSQKKLFVQDGIRSFDGVIVEENNFLVGQFLTFRCKASSIYIIDKESNIIGSYDGTNFNPIQIDNDTFNALLVKTTDTTTQKVKLSFEFSRTEQDEDLKMIAMSELTGVNPLLLTGLLDVNVASSSPATTGFVLKLTTDYGTFKTPINVTGWTATNFTLFNNTTDPSHASPITHTVVENPNGTYTFSATLPTGDNIEVDGSQAGFSFPATIVAIP